MIEKIKDNVSRIRQEILKNQNLGKIVREDLLKNKYIFFEEKTNISKLKEEEEFDVFGADSGFFRGSLTNIDFFYVKVCGSYFKYNKKLVEYKRFPTNHNKELYIPKIYLQTEDIPKYEQNKRLQDEISLLIDAIEKFNPKIIVMDGSIIPQRVDKFSKDSNVYFEYENTIKLFKKLYEITKQKNITLIGCVEDSKSNTFIKKAQIDTNIQDTTFLEYVLDVGEGISFFKADLDYKIKTDFPLEVYISYLKINDDYPLRIETNSNNFELAKNVVYTLSRNFKDYAYPSVLIDADKQAKLNNSEIETIKKMIESEFYKINIKRMRRKRRI